MKKILILILFLISISLSAQKKEITTYYFIRHAEKDLKNSDNPNLTKKGEKRAIFWSEVFKNVKFDLIYSTNYNRTIQTATPTATSKKIKIQIYNPKELYNKTFINTTKGKTVLIVGHSNTTPQFVNKIIGKQEYLEIDESNNSNLYIVSSTNNYQSHTLLKVKY